MALNRLAISALIGIYLVAIALFSKTVINGPLTLGIYALLGVVIFAHLVFNPKRVLWRRILAMCCDSGALSYGIFIGGEITAALYPIYLWVILGNGFRFGVSCLLTATAISVVGFAFVLLKTPFWAQNLWLGIGLMIGLIALPVYASKLIRNLSEAKKAAEQANAAKSLFLAAISHELRTPLHGIIGMSDMLRQTKLDADQKDMTGTLKNSANSLLGLINELLDFSRLEAGQMPKLNDAFELSNVLSQVRGTMAVQAEAKGLRFALHVDAATPLKLQGDHRHLADILTNLAGNAVKFTDNGSVTVGVSTTCVTEEDVVLRFEVTDTGIGVAKEAQARIFDNFTQADDTIINRFGGTGLGLSIAKRLVDLMDGEIGIESEPGKGSTFWFEVAMKRAPSVIVQAPRFADGQMIVLTADDTLAASLETMLGDSGNVPIRAHKPAELVSLLRSASGNGIRKCLIMLDERDIGSNPGELADALIGQEPALAPVLILLSDKTDAALDQTMRSQFITRLETPLQALELRRALRVASIAGIQCLKGDEIETPTASARRAVLIADDNPTNQKVMRKVLENAGHDVNVVANGEEALDALNTHSFDIVLMDLNMPVMNGIEATKLYCFSSLGQKATPIVGVTADATPAAHKRCLDAGMIDCITKPVEPAVLLKKIEEIISADEDLPMDHIAEDDTVQNIASHPKFRTGGQAVIDTYTLEELEKLGGRDFVNEVVGGYVSDAQVTLNELVDFRDRNDLPSFRNQAHALRSGSANVGAQGIFAICSKLEQIDEEEFQKNGDARLRELQVEFAEVRDVLTGYMKGGIKSASE